MSTEHYQKAESLFHECLERERSTRTAFLIEACGNDEALRHEVETLLAAAPEAGAVLESAVRQAVLLAIEADSWEGRRVGPYQIIRELGRGGMGVVFLANRVDEQFEKQVAIKLVAGIRAGHQLTRFRQERQILAGLEHPHIARLLDGGVTADGLPYLVMEYIEGGSLLSYCDDRKLPVRERLKLFRQVCSAVQYAHQNLIVHRDLKPGNILVTAGGEPKLLDFGVAKLLPSDPESESAATLTAFTPLTPQYASPEQVQGGPITTATDVYALGTILYELLNGRKAHTLRSMAPQEITRVICLDERELPSASVHGSDGTGPAAAEIAEHRGNTPERLRKCLRGDLDDIVLRALRVEARERYSSVEQLSGDVQRYLEGLPVMAHKGQVSYRIRKFVSRNRIPLAAATAALAAVVGFVINTGVQSARVAIERDKATQVANFMVGLFSSVDPETATRREISAREILDRGAGKISRELSERPELKATLMETIADVYINLFLYDRAQPLAEEALGIRKRLSRPGDFEISNSKMILAGALAGRGEKSRAEALYLEAVAGRSQFLRSHPDWVARNLNALGTFYFRGRRLEPAERCFREALEISQRPGGNRARAGEALYSLGIVLNEQRQFKAAEPLFREALAIARANGGSDCMPVAFCLNGLALCLREKGDLAGAEQHLAESLALMRRLIGDEHPKVAAVMSNLAATMIDEGKYPEAGSLLLQALDLERRTQAAPSYIGSTLVGLAVLYLRQGDPQRAEAMAREALALSRKHLDPQSLTFAGAENMYGKCLVGLRRYREAEPLLVKNFPIIREAFGEKHRSTLESAKALVTLYESTGRPERAAGYRALAQMPVKTSP